MINFRFIKGFSNNINIIILFIIICTILLCTIPYSEFSGIEEEEDDTLLKRVFNRLYLTTTTLSSVGYGDIYPKSIYARSIIIMMQIFIIFHIANI
jgi:hypothetical protein